MILVALGLLGFGIVDVGRWSPLELSWSRAIASALGGTAAVTAVAAFSGMDLPTVLLAAVISSVVLLTWSAYELLPLERLTPGFALTFVTGVIAALFALSGSADRIGGDVATWYSKLGFGFVHTVPVDQFALGALMCGTGVDHSLGRRSNASSIALKRLA